MPLGLLIPLLLLIVPILEIAVFIVVGGEIGVLATLALVFATAVLGTILLRLQGFQLIARIRSEMEADRIPGRELAHGAMLLAAGILLLTPGFVTDTLGFLLFVPPLRDAIWKFIAARLKDAVVVRTSGGRPRRPGPRRPGAPDVVDLDPADYERRPDPSSPWRDDEGKSG